MNNKNKTLLLAPDKINNGHMSMGIHIEGKSGTGKSYVTKKLLIEPIIQKNEGLIYYCGKRDYYTASEIRDICIKYSREDDFSIINLSKPSNIDNIDKIDFKNVIAQKSIIVILAPALQYSSEDNIIREKILFDTIKEAVIDLFTGTPNKSLSSYSIIIDEPNIKSFKSIYDLKTVCRSINPNISLTTISQDSITEENCKHKQYFVNLGAYLNTDLNIAYISGEKPQIIS